MSTYVEINGTRYLAQITGRLNDHDWDDRESKTITIEETYENVVNIFVDDVQWNIIQEYEEVAEQYDENGDVVVNDEGTPIFVSMIKENIYDNSEYSISGDITDHRDGRVSVKMGKPTAAELLSILEEVL